MRIVTLVAAAAATLVPLSHAVACEIKSGKSYTGEWSVIGLRELSIVQVNAECNVVIGTYGQPGQKPTPVTLLSKDGAFVMPCSGGGLCVFSPMVGGMLRAVYLDPKQNVTNAATFREKR